MENIKLKTGWETLYNSNFPPQVSLDNPEVTLAVKTSPGPISPSEVNNGSLGKKIFIVTIICLLAYGGYMMYKKTQSRKTERA